MKLNELQGKIGTIRELGRQIDRELQNKNEFQESAVDHWLVDVAGVYFSLPKEDALKYMNAHLLKRAEDYKRLCKEIGVEP